MRKERRRLLLAILVAVAVMGWLGWIMLRSPGPPEPVYQGKRLSQWVDDLLPTDQTPGIHVVTASTVQALRHIGTNAIPTLLRMLRAHDSPLKLKLVNLAKKQRLTKIHFVEAGIRNIQAELAFSILGADASNAVPVMIGIYESKISDMSQRSTARSLGYIGPAAAAAVPALLRTAANTNTSAEVRCEAVEVLGAIHSKPELVVAALRTWLNDSKPEIRSCAAEAMAPFAAEARSAVPALVKLLNDPDTMVRVGAIRALRAIDPETAAKAGIK